MLDTFRQTIIEAPGFYVGWGGFAIGFLFGFIVHRTNFCTMGSISDILSFGDHRRFRTWMLVIAVAIIGAQYLQFIGAVDLSASMYMRPALTWFGHVVGGLMFGFGMVLAGGCVGRNLVRVGSGHVGALIVLVVTGIFAYMTIGGIFGPLRLQIFDIGDVDLAAMDIPNQGLVAILTAATGIDAGWVNLMVIAAIVGALLVYCFMDSDFRSSPAHLIAGVGIGLCVVAGWALTGLAFDEMADTMVPTTSLTFVRPSGDTIEYLTRYTALGPPGFGVASLIGTIAGSFVSAIMMKRFHIAAFAGVTDTLRNLGGGALMGVGGVLAFGCTIGQAMTGISTLAVGSLITSVAIISGGIVGVKYVEWRISQEV